METKSLKEISKTNSSDLAVVIYYWTTYDPKYVLCAYAELKRRKYAIPESKASRIPEFCAHYKHPDIETFLEVYLKENGFSSYQECYENEIVAEKKIEQAKATINNSILAINPTNIISAGRNIKSVVYVVLVMIVFAVIAVLTVNSSRNLDTIKNTYLFLGVVSLICNIIILFQLHSAGDNLEKSVIEKQ